MRNRTAGIVKAKGDENATSKHLRQGSGTGIGPSRSTTFGKNTRERPVLNEVTKTAINRKVFPTLVVAWLVLTHSRNSHSRPPARRRSRWTLSSAVPYRPRQPRRRLLLLNESDQLRGLSHHNPSSQSPPVPRRSALHRAFHKSSTSLPQWSKMKTNRAWTSRRRLSVRIHGN